jgi:iron complex transport system substrate-binding protein
MRIVSVLPSATEIVCELGDGASLVGRSSECDYPESVRPVPVVMRPKVNDFDRPSAVIDSRVRSARSRSESLYHLDLEQLRAARPDLLITQDLCSVCSVTEAEAAEACALAGVAPRVVSLSPRSLHEVWESFETVAEAIGRTADGRRLARDARSHSVPPARGAPGGPRVAVVEWLDPPILAGLWVSEMVEAAGGRSIGPGKGEVGQRTSWSALRRSRPDLVVLSPCSFRVERTRREAGIARGIESLGTARPRRGVWIADEAFFSRPGPRLRNGVELLRGLLSGSPPQESLPFERWEAKQIAP